MLVYQLLRAERERRGGAGADMSTASRTYDQVSLAVPLWLLPLCFVLHFVCISKQKQSFSHGAFVCKHKYLSEHFEVVCTQKDGLGWVIFSPENVGQLIPITIYQLNLSTSTLKSNRIIVRRTMAHNKWREMMRVDGMLDKICIVHWMSLSNIPILWITLLYLTNCAIMWQEICFRGSQF